MDIAKYKPYLANEKGQHFLNKYRILVKLIDEEDLLLSKIINRVFNISFSGGAFFYFAISCVF